MLANCPLCDKPDVELSHLEGSGDARYVLCKNCGNFGITSEAIRFSLKEENKSKISALVKEKYLQNELILLTHEKAENIGKLKSVQISSLLGQYPKPSEVSLRILRNLASCITSPTDGFRVITNESLALFFSKKSEDILYFIEQMSAIGWVNVITSLPARLYIQQKGWEIVDQPSAVHVKEDKPNKKIYNTPFADYEEVLKIGEGGEGDVYRVKDSKSEFFALKILKSSGNKKKKRFKNEAHYGIKNTHKNIIEIVDYGIYEEKPFYVMKEYGTTFRKVLEGEDLERKLCYFAQVLVAIEHLHQKEIVHRDITHVPHLFFQYFHN